VNSTSLPVIFSIGLMLFAAGCSAPLRDEYVGSNLIAPNDDSGEVRRDAFGDPILPRSTDERPRR